MVKKLSVRLGIFGAVPISILQEDDLTLSDLRTYISLMSFQGTNDKCYPHQREIGERANLSERQVKRAIKHLLKLNLIMKKRRGKGLTNVYECLSWMEVAPIGDIEKCQLMSLLEVTPTGTLEVTPDGTSILKDHLKDQIKSKEPPAPSGGAASYSENESPSSEVAF